MAAKITFVAQRLSSLNLYKNLYKSCNSNSSFSVSFRELLKNEFVQNSVSDGKYCVEPSQHEFLGNAYLTYLESTQKTLDLYSQYAKGERSTKEAAAIVGLALPKQYEPPKN